MALPCQATPLCPPARRSDPKLLREQLLEMLDLERAGKMNTTLRLRKKALQMAYDTAIKLAMVRMTGAKEGRAALPRRHQA